MPQLRNAPPNLGTADRLRWTAGIAFTCHGARFGIRVNDPGVLARLPQHLPPGSRPSRLPLVDSLYSLWLGKGAPLGGEGMHQLYAGDKCIRESLDPEEILAALEDHLHFHTALGARRKLFVHAGVVGWRGRAIVLPGRSFSGKTSLVAALVRAGATYFSDEYAVFDRRGWVHPYPKPLSIRSDNGRTGCRCPVEELGGQAATAPLTVGLVAAMAYEPGARRSPRLLSPGEMVMALLDNTVLARYRSELALSTFGQVAEQAEGLRGARGEAGEWVPLLIKCLSHGTRTVIKQMQDGEQ